MNKEDRHRDTFYTNVRTIRNVAVYWAVMMTAIVLLSAFSFCADVFSALVP